MIHTVGPRYNIKYKTAAENALFNSYRNTLLLLWSVSYVTSVCPFELAMCVLLMSDYFVSDKMMNEA